METHQQHTLLPAFFVGFYPRLIHFPELVKSGYLFFIFLAIFLCTTSGFAQYTYQLDKTTRFEKMGAEEGLSSGYVSCIHQDKYGFIWIGTQYGLNLYDGYEFKIFTADPNNPHAILQNWIKDIAEEADGTMWFATNIGVSKYNRANQTFKSYISYTNDTSDIMSPDKILLAGDYLWIDTWTNSFLRLNTKTGLYSSFAKDSLNPSMGIYHANSDYIFKDGLGTLWVCSSEAGSDFVLSRFNNETETFIHFLNDPGNPDSFVGKEVRSMMEDREGTIWIATWGGGLIEIIDKEEGRFRQSIHDENNQNSIIHNYLNDVFEDSKGNIWISGIKGFSLLNKETGRYTNYHVPKRSDFPNEYNNLMVINEDINGDLYFTSRDGYFQFNSTSKVLLHYLNDPGNQSSISHNWVQQVLHESSGQTWFVLPNSSINRINQFSNAFKKIQKMTHVNYSLSGKAISRFFTDSRDNFWVGCAHRGGLNRSKTYNRKVYDNFEHFFYNADDPKSISGNRISAIYEDQDQKLWFGTWAGLNRYDYNTNSFTRFQHDPDDSTTISQNIVMCIFEDSYGIFWVGTRNGLNILDKETGEFLRLLPDDNDSASISGIEVRYIKEDSFGELWFGGSYLEKLNRRDTSFFPYYHDSLGVQDIVLKDVWNIVEDDSANLWISTNNDGLYKFTRVDSTFTAFATQQGLPSNTINAIEIDDKGFVWVSTNQGLSRINPLDYSIRNFDMDDGLVSLEFINRSTYKDDEGWLYFGSRDGFNVFHPDSIKENRFIPPIYITSLNVAGEPKYFDKPLYELEGIDLQYNENDFSFDVVALNYINSQKNQYAYKLEGYDKDWQNVGTRRTAFYTNLSPGKYTFRVKGSNNDGYWNEEGASLALVIHPPFWLTWWAYAIYVMVFIVLVYLIRRNELRKINLRQDLELEQQNAENLAALDIEKNKFFSNISHEFRTPLTLILGPLERLIGSPKDENQKQQLNLVKRNARRLQTLINQLLSLSKLESGKMKLRARPENIVQLTRLFIQSFHSMAEDRGITLEFESNADEYIVYVDTIKYEKVVNNLLSNAFKFTEQGGVIKVAIGSWQSAVGSPQSGTQHGTTSDTIKIVFSDTGVGIKKEDLPHVFDRFYQVDESQMKTNLGTGIGLALTKELIELHHGNITADSEPGTGTAFTVLLPIGKDHLSENEIFVRKDSYKEPGENASETDEELLNDDYLFVQDVISQTELETEDPEDSNLPLILIVEDNDDMRSYIKSYLSGSYNIIEAANGKEGAEQAIEHIPDLIVSDLMMPKLDGNEMTIQLKTDERTSHIPIILLTAKASKESKLEGLETGADDFLTKPFDADELLIRIKNLISQRKKLRQLLSHHVSDINQAQLVEGVEYTGMTKLDQMFLEKAKERIIEHLSDSDFNVKVFAREMAMSRVQLHRKLKDLTDNSPSDLIRDLRLMKAAQLLKAGELNVTQVSYEIGILNLSNFAKIFKEKYGVNPSKYV